VSSNILEDPINPPRLPLIYISISLSLSHSFRTTRSLSLSLFPSLSLTLSPYIYTLLPSLACIYLLSTHPRMAESKLALRDVRSPSTSTISSNSWGAFNPLQLSECGDDYYIHAAASSSPTPSSEYSFNFARRRTDRKDLISRRLQSPSPLPLPLPLPEEEDIPDILPQRNALALKSLSLPIPTSPIDAISFPKLPGQRLPQAQVFCNPRPQTPREFEEDRRRLISTSDNIHNNININMHYKTRKKAPAYRASPSEDEPRVCTPAPSFWKAAALFESADVCDALPAPTHSIHTHDVPDTDMDMDMETEYQTPLKAAGSLRHLSLKREKSRRRKECCPSTRTRDTTTPTRRTLIVSMDRTTIIYYTNIRRIIRNLCTTSTRRSQTRGTAARERRRRCGRCGRGLNTGWPEYSVDNNTRGTVRGFTNDKERKNIILNKLI